jgi:hypothetical protein
MIEGSGKEEVGKEDGRFRKTKGWTALGVLLSWVCEAEGKKDRMRWKGSGG